MLPVPRFTPTVRKSRPQPIGLMEGLKKVQVRPPAPLQPACAACGCCAQIGCACALAQGFLIWQKVAASTVL